MARRNVATMKDDIVVDRSELIEQYLPPNPRVPSPSSPSSSRSGDQEEKLNRKQVLLQHNIELRKKFESMVLQWQEILCDPVDEATLGEAANRIKQSHYQEVIEERNIGNLCGYPLCPKPPRDIKGKFRIALHERKVFDISVLKQYCSSTCLSASRWLGAQMTEEPIYLNNTDPAYLKVTRVSIVPLGMELAEFQAQGAKNAVSKVTKPSAAFSLPELRQEDASSLPLSARSPVLPTTSSSAPGSSSSLGNQYVQSLLSSVPQTPSFIKIVERDTTGQILTSDIDHDMQDSLGNDHEQRHEAVDGYRVPVNSNLSRKGSSDQQGDFGRIGESGIDTRAIEQGMSQVNLLGSQHVHSHDHTMQRSASSMSMDTQP
ncbi:Rtr1/RPAP2 family-domain-containing protein [Dissophora ornata]|nr:RNA polymerase II associated protein 2 [Dissophora ornata]KAI8598226.1 Rtr1/RPAP2 family-domain-containing protein [Dissophora ornata]